MTTLADIIFSTSSQTLTEDLETKEEKKVEQTVVHIRNQPRAGKKSITTVEGLATDLDLKGISRHLKKSLATNSTIVKSEQFGEVIQLQGDVRKQVAEFLVKSNICNRNLIKIHGA